MLQSFVLPHEAVVLPERTVALPQCGHVFHTTQWALGVLIRVKCIQVYTEKFLQKTGPQKWSSKT